LNALPFWVDALCSLAARAEALPGPLQPYRPGWLERHPIALFASLGCAVLTIAGIVSLALVIFSVVIS
jgi:hypothetical protein